MEKGERKEMLCRVGNSQRLFRRGWLRGEGWVPFGCRKGRKGKQKMVARGEVSQGGCVGGGSKDGELETRQTKPFKKRAKRFVAARGKEGVPRREN